MTDVFKIADAVELTDSEDVKATEIAQLLEHAKDKDGVYDAIITAYRLGFAVGKGMDGERNE